MPRDSLDVRFGGVDEEELALIVHEALNAMGDGEAAVEACVGWAVASRERAPFERNAACRAGEVSDCHPHSVRSRWQSRTNQFGDSTPDGQQPLGIE
jgi:hypothetical protein